MLQRPYQQGGNRGSAKVANLLNISQLVNERARICTRAVVPQYLAGSQMLLGKRRDRETYLRIKALKILPRRIISS